LVHRLSSIPQNRRRRTPKDFAGPSSNPSDQDGFTNAENALFGVNYQPVTKSSSQTLKPLAPFSMKIIGSIEVPSAGGPATIA
jgi:hypothetical protein